jgi:hypothetical protein
MALLKSGQNEPFVGLVMGNLTAELTTSQGLRPDKILKITEWLLDGALHCTDRQVKLREFCRLKVTEALVRMIAKCSSRTSERAYFENYARTAVSNLQNQTPKGNKKKFQIFRERHEGKNLLALRESADRYNLVSLDQVLAKNSLGKANRTGNLESLMLDYQDLLRDRKPPEDESKLTKDEVVEQLGATGELSKYVDQRFLDECLAVTAQIDMKGAKSNREHVSAFIAALESQKSNAAMPELGVKRQKTVDGPEPAWMLLSPTLAILMHYSRALLSDQWEVR